MRNSILFLALSLTVASGGCRQDQISLPLGQRPVDTGELRSRMQTVLFAAAGSDDAAVRCHAIEALTDVTGSKSTELIRMAMRDPVPAVRFAACVAAADAEFHGAKPKLRQLAKDADPSVRLAAVYGLDKLGPRRFDSFYDKALASGDVQLRAQACLLIGKLGDDAPDRNSKKKLWQVFRQAEQSVPVRLQAAEALGRLGDKAILPKLAVFAGSHYADDRIMAAAGLGLIGGPDAYAMLTMLGDDPQIEVKLAAIRALGADAQTQHVDIVRENLFYVDAQNDSLAAWRIRGLAVLALGTTGTPGDANLLNDAMTAESEYVRVAAAKAAVDFLARHSRSQKIQGM